ncbi:histidine phosphatase family protein [Streptomyces glomeratus]|uniref:Histidine phosphatase family protein n=1 Tax=Streptomyces glomeratus TaxID=284452 RepID=A0ABP6LTM5_9ACTN|nr:histidine phosphatase family protein [Streptomyces glomeratus]MCF1509185.1 histidine phosphatase family protein [Streptomyces glomeratus]
MGDLLLVRHGETEWSRSGQHTSWTDLPLTRRGEEQAESLAPLLAGRAFALTLTSPLGRARRTADLAGLSGAVAEAELHEWDYGGYEGITTAEIHRTRPDWCLWTDGVPPGPPGHPGESPDKVAARADRVLARIAPGLAEGDVILVAHGHFLRVLAARHLGLSAAEGRVLRLDTATVSRLSTEHGRPVIAEWNATGTSAASRQFPSTLP